MSRYEIDRDARDDLHAIYEYIARDSRQNARKMISQLRARFRMLAKNPQMGERRDDLMLGVRCLTLSNYVIFFRETPRGVEIVRVIHGARDIDELFP
ncbi:MAG: type II toxin-antitoxin system RelE/ParE family toxin [Pirellulales bacterium]